MSETIAKKILGNIHIVYNLVFSNIVYSGFSKSTGIIIPSEMWTSDTYVCVLKVCQ